MPSSLAPGVKRSIVVEHRRDDAGRPVRRRRHDAPAGRVLFAHGEREQVDPIHHLRADRFAAPCSALVSCSNNSGARRRTLSPPGNTPFLPAAALDARLHHVPPLEHARANLRLAPPAPFVRERHVADREARLRGHTPTGRRPCDTDTAAASRRARVDRRSPRLRRPRTRRRSRSRCIPARCRRRHRGPMNRIPFGCCGSDSFRRKSRFARLVERNRRPAARASSRPLSRIAATRGSTSSGSIPSGVAPSSPSRIALSVPCPLPVSASDPYSRTSTRTPSVEHSLVAEPLDKPPRRAHRPNRVRTARPDADREQIEDADGHALLYAEVVVGLAYR